MCGISGIIDKNRNDHEKIIGKMVEKIHHRGPDQDGFFVDSLVGLGMRRLSIIDLSSGKQPIWSGDQKKCIFFNGEIYNYQELREDLEKKGRKFSTNSDTEVILQMYEEYAEASLPRLRGMFAFCIYNKETEEIFIARDFFGIKPLYFWRKNGQVVAFASEIKSFLEIPEFKVEVNDSAVYNYLSFQYNPLSETFFKNVWKLPPAHFLKINLQNGKEEIKPYWSFDFKIDENLDEKETLEKIRQTVEDSVRHHMIADVPVGSFLSGGVDSSIIATMMQKIRGENPEAKHGKVKTFTVGWQTFSEGMESKETSDFLGTDHTEITIDPNEYFEILPKIVWHFDEPVADPSAVGLYFVSREARKHVTVVLSGEGADEFFGGYNIYLAPFAYKKIAWVPKKILKILFNLPFNYFGKNYIGRAYKKLSDWYIGNASIFSKNEINLLWKGSREETFSLNSLYEKVSSLPDSVQMQYIDINTWLVGDILAKADKMTMANSLELRVPFLDIEVSKLARVLPSKFKWRAGQTKYLFRKAFSGLIPETTRNRKKLGFATPVRDWFTADREDLYKKILENKYIKSHFDVSIIQNLIGDHITKKYDNSRKIYLLLMLALWYDVY